MSLEQKIEALTAAVEKLTAKFEGGSKTPLYDKVTAASAPAEKPAKAAAEKPAAEKPAKAAAEKPAADVLTYEDVRKVIISAIEKVGKDAVVAKLKDKFGVPKAQDIEEKKWPKVIEVINALVAEGAPVADDEDDVA